MNLILFYLCLFQNRNLNKSTDSVKYIPLDRKSDKEHDHTESEIFKRENDIGTELEDNVKELIEENESLRKGMHEILDSIHNQDGIYSSYLLFRCKLCKTLYYINILY